jgi:hypothetical protein
VHAFRGPTKPTYRTHGQSLGYTCDEGTCLGKCSMSPALTKLRHCRKANLCAEVKISESFGRADIDTHFCRMVVMALHKSRRIRIVSEIVNCGLFVQSRLS